MVLAHAPRHGDAQQLLEEQHDVPVEFCRTLHVAAFPRLLHEDRHCPAGHEALSLQIPLVAHHQDWHLVAAALPAGARERWKRKKKKKETDKTERFRHRSCQLGVTVAGVCARSP